MKNQNRYGKEARLLALLLSALLLLGAFPMGALAAQTGSLTVKLRQDIYDDLPKDEAVKVTLYQIGVAAPGTKAGWEINDAFSLYGILGAGSSGELAGIAEKIAGDIVGKDGFSGKEQTLENGQTRFSNLEQGVYLGVLTSGPEGLEADPFIVTVPSRNPETKDVLFDYDVILKETCVTEATVRKVWDDANDQDGIRPASLTVKLSNGQSVTLNAANNWTATIGSLPRYKDGVAIAYTWTEEGLPAGYELTGNGTDGTVTTLTNRHTPETISLTVRKVWDDANNRDGLRPVSLTVQLSNGTTVIRTATLNAANNWTATVDNLPRFENGKEIAYTWTEEGLPAGYVLAGTTRNGAITTLTNRHAPEVVSATVRKVWDDANDQDHKRPASLTVKLSNGDFVTLNEANKWEATLNNLPKYKDGEEITYSWTEEGLPEGYVLAGTATEGIITTLTNRHAPETTTATVRKVWDDGDNRDGIRPASLTVKLSNGQSVTLNAANGWSATIGDLPKYDKGVEIVYTWTEESLPEGYELTGNVTSGTVTTLTNHHTPERTSATVRKVWDDDDNRDGIRPASLTVRLSNGESVTLDEANNWTATIDNLLKNRNGEAINYTWTEEDLPEGYKLTNTAVEGTVTTLTNTHVPAKVFAQIMKSWADDKNRDGIRPESVTMRLSNGQTVTLNEENEWIGTIEGLPRYENGKEIVYTWTEENVPEGYEMYDVTEAEEGPIVEYDDNGNKIGTITWFSNGHEPEQMIIRVKKEWDDFYDADGLRPDGLEVNLIGEDGRVVATVILSEADNWTAEIRVPRNENGHPAKYTWEEVNLPEGYEFVGARSISTEQIGEIPVVNIVLTNSHTPETTSRTVRKVWQDENNEDGSRPTRLNVTLWDDFTEVGKAVLDAANNWEATIDNLPKNRAGKEIAYYWTEDATVGYLLREPVIEGNVTTLTNVHVPRVNLTEINGQKVWEDNHNEHKVRPANITVLLYADGTQVNASPIWRSRTGDTWSYTFSGLPAQNANGDTIHYTVDEQAVEYYDKEVSGTTITNRLVPRQPQNYQEIKGVKTWEDDNNTGGTRPDSVKVSLFRDGVEIASVVITEATDWSYSFGRQPMDDGYGNQYHYEVREDGVPGYLCRVDGFNLINKLLNRPNNPNPGTRTNSRIQPTGGVSVFKEMTSGELEETVDLFGYNTPLWGGLLGTGDETPIYPYIFGGVGVVAVIAAVIFGRKRKKGSK